MVKGTHILINAKARSMISASTEFKSFLLSAIHHLGLSTVGDVFHDFEGGGFTCVVCLTESHIALHTWPEFNFYTCDIYLCDYSQNNYTTTLELAKVIKEYFHSFDIKENIIER